MIRIRSKWPILQFLRVGLSSAKIDTLIWNKIEETLLR
jgi:hypothetical protein